MSDFIKSNQLSRSTGNLRNAPAIDNTGFLEGTATDLACLGRLEESSADLITAAQMIHWLTLEKTKLHAFTRNAAQFLAPGGVVCLVGCRKLFV